MHRLSIRMILFIVVLSALHMSGITPAKPPAIRVPQEAPSRPAASPQAPQEIAQLRGDLRRTIQRSEVSARQSDKPRA